MEHEPRRCPRGAVDRVAEHRQPGVGEVRAHLVLAARAWPRLDEESVAEHLADGDAGVSGQGAVAADAHRPARRTARGERRVDRELARRQRRGPDGEGEVRLLGVPAGEGTGEPGVRLRGETEQHDAGRVAVEPLVDGHGLARGVDQPLHVAGEAGAVRVDGRVGRQARRLRDGDEPPIAVQDRLGAEAERPVRRPLSADADRPGGRASRPSGRRAAAGRRRGAAGRSRARRPRRSSRARASGARLPPWPPRAHRRARRRACDPTRPRSPAERSSALRRRPALPSRAG